MKDIRIFLASRFVEFQNLRTEIQRISERDEDSILINLDDGLPSSDSPRDRSIKEISNSDIAIFIFGYTYSEKGSRDSNTSVTEQEFDTAIRSRNSGMNVKIRAWCLDDESKYSRDALDFLNKAREEIVIGTINSDDWELAANSILSDAQTQVNYSLDGDVVQSFGELIERELARLGVNPIPHPPGNSGVIDQMLESRALAMDALRAGRIDDAIDFFEKAHAQVSFDLVTNISMSILMERTDVPSKIRRAVECLHLLEKNQYYGTDVKNQVETDRRIQVLAASMRTRLNRTLSSKIGKNDAFKIIEDLEVLRQFDETSRPLLVEIVVHAGIAENYDLALERFRELWHMYPSWAFYVLYSNDFQPVSRRIEIAICGEYSHRLQSRGITVPKILNLKELRNFAIRYLSSEIKWLGENFEKAADAAIQIRSDRSLASVPESKEAAQTALSLLDENIKWAEHEGQEIVNAAKLLGITSNNSSLTDELLSIASQSGVTSADLIHGSGAIDIKDLIEGDVVHVARERFERVIALEAQISNLNVKISENADYLNDAADRIKIPTEKIEHYLNGSSKVNKLRRKYGPDLSLRDWLISARVGFVFVFLILFSLVANFVSVIKDAFETGAFDEVQDSFLLAITPMLVTIGFAYFIFMRFFKGVSPVVMLQRIRMFYLVKRLKNFQDFYSDSVLIEQNFRSQELLLKRRNEAEYDLNKILSDVVSLRKLIHAAMAFQVSNRLNLARDSRSLLENQIDLLSKFNGWLPVEYAKRCLSVSGFFGNSPAVACPTYVPEARATIGDLTRDSEKNLVLKIREEYKPWYKLSMFALGLHGQSTFSSVDLDRVNGIEQWWWDQRQL